MPIKQVYLPKFSLFSNLKPNKDAEFKIDDLVLTKENNSSSIYKTIFKLQFDAVYNAYSKYPLHEDIKAFTRTEVEAMPTKICNSNDHLRNYTNYACLDTAFELATKEDIKCFISFKEGGDQTQHIDGFLSQYEQEIQGKKVIVSYLSQMACETSRQGIGSNLVRHVENSYSNPKQPFILVLGITNLVKKPVKNLVTMKDMWL